MGQKTKKNEEQTPKPNGKKHLESPEKNRLLLIYSKGPSLKALGFLTKSILKCSIKKGVTQSNFRKDIKYCPSNTLFTRKCRTKQSHLPYTENLKGKDILEPYLINCWKTFYYIL